MRHLLLALLTTLLLGACAHHSQDATLTPYEQGALIADSLAARSPDERALQETLLLLHARASALRQGDDPWQADSLRLGFRNRLQELLPDLAATLP